MKVVVMGQQNDSTHDIYFEFNDQFDVKICPMDYDLFQGIRKVFKPSLLVICMAECVKIDPRIMYLLADTNRSFPIITLGLEKLDAVYEKMYSGSGFSNLEYGATGRDVLEAACEMLDLEMPDESGDGLIRKIRSNKPRVLVVDDFGMLLRQIKMMLQDHYVVDVATSGVQAMTTIGKNKPDIIILDYAMPVYDGRQVFEVLKIGEETKDIPVVFLTGVSSDAKVEELINLKPAGYLLKPPNKDRLVDMIEEVLERQRKKEMIFGEKK